MDTNVLKDITMNNDGNDITITDTIGPGDVPPPRAGLVQGKLKSLDSSVVKLSSKNYHLFRKSSYSRLYWYTVD